MPNGPQGSAVIFSMIETAKENRLDPYRYLVWVLSLIHISEPTRH